MSGSSFRVGGSQIWMADSRATSVAWADVVALLAELLRKTSTNTELCFHTICSLELPH